MAEGDTVLRLARRLDSALSGRRVAVRAPNPRGRASGVERLDGTTLESVESRGKHLLLRFEGGRILHNHLGMNGSWQVYARGARWHRPPRSAWVILATEAREAAQFGGSTLRVLEERRLGLDPMLARLGPDILGQEFSAGVGVQSLRRGGPTLGLGEALLDQRLIAGIGNIFKSEGCFATAISPWRSLAELEDDELAELLVRTRELMGDAAESGRHHHAVYRRPGQPCPRCGAPLRARGQGDANRITYWCAGCQS
jgi:endonuclease VIII